jgi:hypothetical protein
MAPQVLVKAPSAASGSRSGGLSGRQDRVSPGRTGAPTANQNITSWQGAGLRGAALPENREPVVAGYEPDGEHAAVTPVAAR